MVPYASSGAKAEELVGAYATVRPGGSGTGEGPTHLGSNAINGLFQGGDGEYLTLTGRVGGGFILTKLSIVSASLGYDAYRGIYDTAYMESQGFSALYEESSSNTFILPRATPPWVSTSMSARSCGAGSVNCFHYLPDDITGGGQWLFRENSDDTPTTAYASSNVPSLLFIR